MPTECSAERFEFGEAAGRVVVAGKSTLNQLEPRRPEAIRYHRISHDPAAIEARFVDLFLDAHRQPPTQITLDLDATDDLLHGHQEGRFFHGYYDCFCYLPLYVFCGRHLLAARLRTAVVHIESLAIDIVKQFDSATGFCRATQEMGG